MPYGRRRYSGYNRRYGMYGRTTRPMPRIYKRPSAPRVYPRTYRGFSRTAIKKAITSMAEHKYVDYNQTEPLTLSFAPQFFCLTTMDQGNSVTTRVGDKVTGISLQLRMRAWLPPATASTIPNTLVRIIIFIWKDDTEPNTGDLLEETPTITDCCLQMLHHDKRVKRKILYDTCFRLNNDVTVIESTATSLAGPNSQNLTIKYIPLKKLSPKNRTINFEAGSNTTAVNHIYLVAMADANPNTTLVGPNFDFISRYNYVDV